MVLKLSVAFVALASFASAATLHVRVLFIFLDVQVLIVSLRLLEGSLPEQQEHRYESSMLCLLRPRR